MRQACTHSLCTPYGCIHAPSAPPPWHSINTCTHRARTTRTTHTPALMTMHSRPVPYPRVKFSHTIDSSPSACLVSCRSRTTPYRSRTTP